MEKGGPKSIAMEEVERDQEMWSFRAFSFSIFKKIYKVFLRMWTIFKLFIEFVTALLLLFMFWFLWLWGMWDLSYLTRDWTCNPCFGRWSLNRWTTREVPMDSCSAEGSGAVEWSFWGTIYLYWPIFMEVWMYRLTQLFLLLQKWM